MSQVGGLTNFHRFRGHIFIVICGSLFTFNNATPIKGVVTKSAKEITNKA